MKYTILGSSGFIGSHVLARASHHGHDVWCPRRDERLDTQDAGHIIFCVGMTANFRGQPHQTIDAHVTYLQRVLQQTTFESLAYLSSTRVYQHLSTAVADEESSLVIFPREAEDLYAISKILGENLLMQHDGRVRIARLSNVLGYDVTSENFLFSVIRDCVCHGRLHLKQSLASVKDYVDVGSVADLLLRLGPCGSSVIYNVASGANVSHGQILQRMEELTGVQITIAENAKQHSFPRINIERIQREFNFKSTNFLEQLPALVENMRQHYKVAA